MSKKLPKDIQLRQDLKTMSDNQLNSYLKKNINIINKRLVRLEQSNLYKTNPAYHQTKKFIKEHYMMNADVDYHTMYLDPYEVELSSRKEKIDLTIKLEHYKTFRTTVKESRKIRNKVAKSIEKKLGRKPTDEEIDRIGEIMGMIYREEGSASLAFQIAKDSKSAYDWAIEHVNFSDEEFTQFLDDLSSFYEEHKNTGYSADISDFIDYYNFGKQSDIAEINGLKIDITSNKVLDINNQPTSFFYDATSEKIIDLDTNKQLSIEDYLNDSLLKKF